MDILQKTTSELDTSKDNDLDASDIQYSKVSQIEGDLITVGETTDMEVHRVLELRSPVIVRVGGSRLIV